MTYAMLLSMVACKQESGTHMLKDEGIEADIAGSYQVVVTRNFPTGTSKGMMRMSPNLHLGQNAFVSEVSDSWLKMLNKLQSGTPANNLPVLFAKSFVFADGKTRLAVGQLECSMTGDGSFSPSSTFSCVLYTIDISSPTKPVIIWQGRSALGTLQNSRIVRMVDEVELLNEAKVILEEDHGGSRIVITDLLFKPSQGYSITMERSPAREANHGPNNAEVAKPSNSPN